MQLLNSAGTVIFWGAFHLCTIAPLAGSKRPLRLMTNAKAFRESLFLGPPILRNASSGGGLQYRGPLPLRCSCGNAHAGPGGARKPGSQPLAPKLFIFLLNTLGKEVSSRPPRAR